MTDAQNWFRANYTYDLDKDSLHGIVQKYEEFNLSLPGDVEEVLERERAVIKERKISRIKQEIEERQHQLEEMTNENN